MCKYGQELAEGNQDTQFGASLNIVGESLRQMAGIKYALEDNIKQNFLDPLTQLKDNEIKGKTSFSAFCLPACLPVQEIESKYFLFLTTEVLALRKKTENRRLDFDCKKRKKSSGSTAVTDEEVRAAEDKFEESKSMTEQAMARVLSNELEHITHLIGFAEGFLEYHNQCYEILKDMTKQLHDRFFFSSSSSSSSLVSPAN